MIGSAALVTVYVELEALLDIEMAVATTLDPEAIRKWGKKWHYRPYNLEPEKQAGVTYTYEEFKNALANIDETILDKCIPTELMWRLCYVVADYMKDRLTGIAAPDFSVHVNTYPFEFVGDAAIALKEGVQQYLGAQDSVEIIYRHPATLHPSEIRKTYNAMFFYDFKRWHLPNQMLLEDNPICNVLVVARRISETIPDSDLAYDKLYEAIELSNAPVMFMRFFGIKWFSYFIPPRVTPPKTDDLQPSSEIPPHEPTPSVEPF